MPSAADGSDTRTGREAGGIREAAIPAFGWKRLVGRWLPTRPWTLEELTLALGLGVFGLGAAAAVFASAGLFRVVAPWLLLLVSVWAGAAVWRAVRRRLKPRLDRYDLVAIVIALLAAVSAGTLGHDYFTGVSDQGFYLADSITMARTGGRILDGPYDGLLPGHEFVAEGVRVSAMFGYPALGAFFYLLGGLDALLWVNAPLALITSLALYLVGRRLGATTGAVLGQAFFAASILTVWLSRWYMTENAAIAVFWVMALLVLKASAEGPRPTAAPMLVAAAYGALVRPENLLIMLWLWAAYVWSVRRFGPTAWVRRVRAAVVRRPWRAGTIGLGAAAVTVVAVLTVVRSLPAGYLVGNASRAVQILRGRPIADSPDVPTTGPSPNWGDYALRFQWDSAVEYFVPLFLVVLVLGLAIRTVPLRPAAWLAVLAVPYLAFVMMPPVTPYHPWFMRRLWVALLPLVWLLAGVALDVHRATMRWPVSIQGKARPRLGMGFAAIALAVVLFVAQLGTSFPVLVKEETDGVRATRDALLASVPEDAVLIFDEDVAPYGPLLRLVDDRDVVVWFLQRQRAFIQSFQAAEDHPRSFVVRLVTDRETVMSTDLQGAVSYSEIPVHIEFPYRYNLRDYLTFAPLPQGYEPLQTYLDIAMPPNAWRTIDTQFALLEVRSPLVLQKNIRLVGSEWQRSDQGMVALVENASIPINRALYVPQLLETIPIALHVVRLEGPAPSYEGVQGNVTIALAPVERSEIGHGLVFELLPLPVPLRLDEIRVQKGAVLRGVYLGPWEAAQS